MPKTTELNIMLGKIISGGQTGVDRAALDVALELGIPCGGFCTRGRRAEDGPIDPKYPLTELPTADYPARTRANVEAGDATLILMPHAGRPTGGTKLTVECADRAGKLRMVANVSRPEEVVEVVRWLRSVRPNVLNVGGPRESKSPGIYAAARAFLLAVLDARAAAREG